MSKSFRVLAAALTVLSIATLAFGDTVRLKDGSRIKGKIVSFGGGKFVVAMGDGSRRRQLTFQADEIESIEFDAPQTVDVSNRNASYTGPVRKVEEVAPRVVQAKPKVMVAGVPNAPSKMTPIEWNVNVLADNTANGWTNSGWVVKKGQRVRISGDGTISLGKGRKTSSSGVAEYEDGSKLLKNVATGALIAVIGDDNNDFIYVGSEREFTATRDGALFLGVNEGKLDDNSGSFSVKIEILQDAIK
ncbi:MAG: LecA/PA-IL family lectin [Pyrinomonadaceae bacterium]